MFIQNIIDGWHVRVRIEGKERARVFVRKSSFETGPPLSFDNEYTGITTLEYVLGAIGADMVIGMQRLARLRRIEIDDIEAVIEGHLNNPLVFLGVVGEEGHPGLERIQVKMYVSSFHEKKEVETLWAEMLRTSPLVQTFMPALDFKIELKVTI